MKQNLIDSEIFMADGTYEQFKIQIKGMIEKSQIEGVKAGLIIWYIDKDITVWIPINEVNRLIDAGYKSINVKNLEDVKHIIIRGTKKRIYFDYYMNDFLEVLYEQV